VQATRHHHCSSLDERNPLFVKSTRAHAALRQKVTMSPNPFTLNPFASQFTFQNPFAGVGEEQTPVEAVNGEASYVMVQSAPHVPAEEVESAHLDAIEVVIKWGHTALHVEHLSPVRPFVVGEANADYILPAESLGGLSSIAIVSLDMGMAKANAPAGVVANVTTKEGHKIESRGDVALADGTKVVFGLPNSEITFEVSAVRAGRKIETGFLANLSMAAHKYTALSFIAHAAIFATFAFFMPKMNADDADSAERDNILMMQKMLNASAEREQEQLQQDDTGATDSQKTGGTGEQAKGDEGQLGKTTPTDSHGRYGFAGPKDNPDPQLQRKEELQAAKNFGMIGILSSMSMDPNAPAAAWGADDALGRDEKSAMGNMWGATIDEAIGSGGLGLSGTGEGGGGNGAGIGLDKVGGLGNGAGCTNGHCGQGIGPGGMGISTGRLPHAHIPKGPTFREAGPISANGHLPAEVIQRVVRQNFGRFRACYESGMRNNPGLQGRVAVKFVIGRDGSVNVAQDAGSDLPDQGVVGCVVRSFQTLSFPSPDNGIVTVTYPIMLTPGE
jgi:hypothetical protein